VYKLLFCTFFIYRSVRVTPQWWSEPIDDVLVSSVTISSEPLECNPVLFYGAMKYLIGLSVSLKSLTLNDLEVPFCAEIRFFLSLVSLNFSASFSEASRPM